MEVQVFSTAPFSVQVELKVKTLVVIPARFASTRLPGKMLADIGGKPLIVRTYESVAAANVGDVIVACDSPLIYEAITRSGGTACLTDPNLPSGTDRVYAALRECNQDYEYIINVQGDLPFIATEFIQAVNEMIRSRKYDICTLATLITNDFYKLPSTVKPVIAFTEPNKGRALYFSRAEVPYGGPYYHHVGIYGFRSETLQRFVQLPQSKLEKAESLEQLRALENGMSVGITVIDAETPISIDTSEDLRRARQYWDTVYIIK